MPSPLMPQLMPLLMRPRDLPKCPPETTQTRLRSVALLGLLAVGVGTSVIIASATIASANDGTTSWINFPGQNKGVNLGPDGVDRNFVKEWNATPPKGFPTLAKENLNAMKAAIKRYEDIVAQGGFPTIPDGKLIVGALDPAVSALKLRLSLSGDLVDDSSGSQNFDYDLEKAVRRFQASNGLSPTGVVDPQTSAALNVPAAVRLRQLKTNHQRLSELARTAPKKYVVVNIPAAQIEAIDGDKIISRHAGVVGKVDRQTPILKSQIHELNFNPVWHLPPTVITKDLLPKAADMAKKGQDAMTKYNIEVLDGAGRKVDSTKVNWASSAAAGYSFRQQPGPENPLGFVKINFHNSHSVYMHSTPSETLFGRNFRAASSGCVRVAGIDQLATWLMGEQGWTHERVLAMKKSGERFDAKLKKPIPLYFIYITAWATEDGVIQFRRDLYNKDNVGALAGKY